MSIRQMSECFYTPSLKPNQRLIALALADYADDHGRAWPSLRNIGAKTGYSRRQTQRIVGELEDIGYVEILTPATWNRTPLYQLHPEQLKREETMAEPPLPFPPDAQEALDRGANLTPRGDTSGTQEATDSAPGGDTGDTLNRQEPSREPPEESLEEDETDVSRETPSTEIERFTDETPAEPRPRNPGWDALEAVFGYRPEGTEAGLWGQIAARANAEPDPATAVIGRARALAAQWGAKALTPASLKKWWDRFGTPLGQATDADLARLRADLQRAERAEQASRLEAEGPPPSARDREAARAIVQDVDTYEEEEA